MRAAKHRETSSGLLDRSTTPGQQVEGIGRLNSTYFILFLDVVREPIARLIMPMRLGKKIDGFTN